MNKITTRQIELNKEEVQRQINKHKVQIDRKCFEKSDENVLALKEAKLNHKSFSTLSLEEGREDIVRRILSSKTPKWGGVNLIYKL